MGCHEVSQRKTRNRGACHNYHTNKWLGQNKLLANQLVEKLPENSFPQRRLD
jgi:hypothetical protein